MASGKKIMLGAAEETISGDGTDITFEVGSSGDINIPANIGLTFGDDGEKIEGDGTDLTVSGNNINLTATADVVVPPSLKNTSPPSASKIISVVASNVIVEPESISAIIGVVSVLFVSVAVEAVETKSTSPPVLGNVKVFEALSE